MIEHEKLSFDFSKCTDLEKEILEKYWDIDENGKSPLNLKDIYEDYNMTQNKLYDLARKYYLVWTHGACQDCGSIVTEKITKRGEWFSCMKYGGGGSPGFDSYFIDTGSCRSCRSEKQMKEFEEQGHDDFSMDWSNFISNERVEEEYLVEKIDRLTRLELKTLYKIYELQDFSLIKDSTELFPLKGNTNYEKKVWSCFYTLGQKGLVSLIRNQNYIYGVKLIPGVQNLLSNLQEQKSLVLDHVDFKIPLLRVDEDGQMKYFGSLNSNLDVILKAGNMYEFFATPNDDGSLLLKIINVS